MTVDNEVYVAGTELVRACSDWGKPLGQELTYVWCTCNVTRIFTICTSTDMN